MAKDKIVTFQMPDGTEVSNDPRWVAEMQQEAMEAALEATPNSGVATPHPDDELAAVGGGVGAPQSGQPGVGEAATFDNPDDALGAKLTGRVLSTGDARLAEDEGNSPSSPRSTPPEPVDSNARVQEARDRREAQRQAAMEALAEAGQEPGDHDKPYEEWTAKQLKAEVAARKARGEDIDVKGVKKKDELAARLREADSANE